jgi:hypothetical protein
MKLIIETICIYRSFRRSLLMQHPMAGATMRQNKGFALFLVMFLLSAVGLFISGLAYSRLLDKRLLKARDNHEKAKDIALFALDLGLAHLEQSLGPKSRTSTTPFLDKKHPKAYWTGVWEKEALQDATFMGYLVPLQEPAGECTFFQGDMAVRVPKVSLPGGEGFYSYWIGDEGLKAKMNLGEALATPEARDVSAPKDAGTILAYMNPEGIAGFESLKPSSLRAIQDWFCASKTLELSPSTIIAHYHHLSWRSYGLLVNPLDFRNTAALELKKDLHTLGMSETPLSPEEHLIHSFQSLSQNVRLDPSPIIDPQPFSIERESPYAAATLKQLGLGPICTGCQIDFSIEHTTVDKLSVYHSIQLSLWNPYAIALNSHNYEISILCNKKPALLIKKESASSAEELDDKLSQQYIELSNQDSEELGYRITIVKAGLCTDFKPGEHKVFVLTKLDKGLGKADFAFEEITKPQEAPARILIKEEMYLLLSGLENKPIIKDPREGLHAKRQVRRERVQNPHRGRVGRAEALEPRRQALGKTYENLSWPSTLIRLNSTHPGYETDCSFQELHLPSVQLLPLLIPDSIPSTAHLALQYQQQYQADKPFQNNPRAYIPPNFEAREDAAWKWLWQSSQHQPLEPLIGPSSPLVLFDIGPLDSVAKAGHILCSLDPNSPMYGQDKAHYHDLYYCPNDLTISKHTGAILEGAFNINSRSVLAWESVLQSSCNPRLRPCGSFSRCQLHTPSYTLSISETKALAQNIVDLLNQRPPLFSIFEFIQAGILDEAIEQLNLPYKEHPLLKLSSLDLLQGIGPLLSPRSDTFRMRAEGEYFLKKDTEGRALFSKANCEALVQRVIEEDSAGKRQAKFKILNLRWLDADKL